MLLNVECFLNLVIYSEKKVRKYNMLLLLKEFEEAKKFLCSDVSIFWLLAQSLLVVLNMCIALE